jgi:hypothetical protein
VEVQAASLLITIIQTPDITDRHRESTASFADVDDAIDAVRIFLSRYAAHR